jgi:lysophospholipase L1-like esterase
MKRLFMLGVFVAMTLLIASCDEITTKTLDRLSLVEPPAVTEYVEGTTFEPDGLQVDAVYVDSEGLETTEDVTADLTFDKTMLALGDEKVVASYTDGDVTKTLDIAITVLPLHDLIGDGPVIDVPDTGLVITATSTSGTATSHWMTSYGEDAFTVTVVVEDMDADLGSGIFNGDGIEILLSTPTRDEGLTDGTLQVNVRADGTAFIQKVLDGVMAEDTESSVTTDAEAVSFEGTYVEGYRITVTVPYTELGTTGPERNVTFLPGLYNNQGSLAIVEYDLSYSGDPEQSHTFIHVTDDDTYAENPWLQLGYVFGNTELLETTPSWDLSNDDGTEGATIDMTHVEAGTDNNAYFYKTTGLELFAYVTLSAKEVMNGEQWGKFGLTVTTTDGLDGFLYFIDGSGDGESMTGTGIGVVGRDNGGWTWPEKTLATLDSADAYQNGNGVELSIYRDGDVFAFYLNGTRLSIQGGFPGIGADTEVVVGLASFNITVTASSYGITTEAADLEPLRFTPEDVNLLFIGDSYIDTQFWTSFDLDFPDSAANLGIGGTTVADWTERVYTVARLYTPQSIIIHVGVNDINAGTPGATVLSELEAMIALYKEQFPTAVIHIISIEPNNFMPEHFDEAMIVNNGIATFAEGDAMVVAVDTVTPLGGTPGQDVAQYFGTDGLHFNADGYGIFAKTIQDALGIPRENAYGFGDEGIYARSGGWITGDGYVENIGHGEQHIYLENAMGTDFAASFELSVRGIYANDPFPKVGVAVKSAEKTVLFFIDVNQTFDNTWGNHVVRPTGSDWIWAGVGGLGRQFVDLGGAPYNNDQYKMMGVIRVGTSLYFLSDNNVVQYAEGIFAEDEETQVSVMMFNLNVRVRNAFTATGEDLVPITDMFKISAKTGPMIDGSVDDWTEAQLSNPFVITGSDGRAVNVHAFMAPEGVYVAYDVTHNGPYVNDRFNWWENTNLELKLGTDNQRFASANGMYSRREGDDFGQRDVGTASFVTTTSGDKIQTVAELFIPWVFIDGYSFESAFVPAGFAWKSPGEEGSIWGGGDFWYVPEADPGMRTQMITPTGFHVPEDIVTDGLTDDWDPAVLATAWTGTEGTRTFASAAFVGTDGVYGMFTVTTDDPVNLMASMTAGEWWQNPNLEIWVNDQHARVMMYMGDVYATGRISSIGFDYDDLTNTMTIEFFITFHALGLPTDTTTVQFRIGSNSWNGGWFMPVDPNQTVTAAGLPPRP